MPTYVYECSQCNDVYEVEQRIIEDALIDCRCGAKGSLKRLIQPIAVVFSGSGFHINDYAAPAASPAPATESPKESPATEVSTPAPVAPAETPKTD